MNGWRQKKWGHVKTLFSNAGCLVELLRIVPGGKSSIHCHEQNFNRFIVVSGGLCVNCGSYDPREVATILEPGDAHTVNPTIRHQFIASRRGATVLEIYFTEESPRSVEDDIVRITNALGSPPL